MALNTKLTLTLLYKVVLASIRAINNTDSFNTRGLSWSHNQWHRGLSNLGIRETGDAKEFRCNWRASSINSLLVEMAWQVGWLSFCYFSSAYSEACCEELFDHLPLRIALKYLCLHWTVSPILRTCQIVLVHCPSESEVPLHCCYF